MIDYRDYLRLLPKVELHCHFVATIRPATLVELARRHDVPLPAYDADALFDYDNIVDFLTVFEASNRSSSTVACSSGSPTIGRDACRREPALPRVLRERHLFPIGYRECSTAGRRTGLPARLGVCSIIGDRRFQRPRAGERSAPRL